jgi:TP901 family phage tail tape measure protein
MANEVRFNIRLNIDGKEKVVTATTAVDNLRRVVDNAKGAAGALQEQLINTNQIVEKWNNVSNAIGQLSSVLNDITAESRSFGGAMAAANTMAGKSGEEFAKLKDQVAELSHEVPIARDKLANGLYQVISNGVPENNWITFLNKSARASVAGIANLEETVKVTSTIIKNYGLDWEAAGSIQDKIQLTAKNGVTSFEQLAQALPRVTSQAATLGVSVDELMATFSTLTGVSGDTAEVSTQLAAIFTALIKPSSEAAEIAQQMGIQFDAAAIKAAGGMEQFLQQLGKSVQEYSKSSGVLEQEVYGKLFGSAESLRALTPLMGNLSDKFSENVSSMKDSAGTIDNAFDTVAHTGSSTLQMLNNKLGEYSDTLQKSIGNVLPYISISAQMAMCATSIVSLSKTFNILAVLSKLARTSIAMFSPIVEVCSATMRGAAVSAETLKLAIRSLMISTGVGIAIVALTEIIGHLINSNTQAAESAKNMASEEAKAADNIQSAYDSTLKSTYANLITKYEQLKDGWKNLRSEHEKTAWIKNNQSAFAELKIKVNGVADAENIFRKNTGAVVEAFTRRAQAAAYAAKLTELYQKQIGLVEQKNKVVQNIANDAKKGGRHAKEGDVVPESWRSERYGRVGNDGQWRFTKVGAERYNGTNVSGDKQVAKIDNSINNLSKQIEDTKKQMASAANGNGWIDAGKTTSGTGGTGGRVGSGGTTNHTPSVTDEEDNPLKGSIDWYIKAIDEKKRQLYATANEATAKSLNNEMEALQRDLYFLKVRIGVEVPPPIEVKKTIKPMAEQLQESFDDMQKYLKEHPLQVQADPKRLEKLTQKMEDFEKIKGLGNVDLGNFEGVRKAMTDIQGIVDPTAKGFAAAGTACQALGGAMQQLGSDSAAAKAGLVMAAIGQLALSLATAMTDAAKQSWITWLAFGISGTAQLVSMVATISQFATGGIVGGNSKSGDRVLARVNSGEMILNAAQQAQLFAIANGRMQPTVNTDVLTGLMAGGAGGVKAGSVVGKIRGRDIVLVTANETRQMRRRSNIKI